LNVDADGMSDVAIVGTNSVTWFHANERTTGPATMTKMTSTSDTNLSPSGRPF
jgi:hypothetical protein